MNRLITITFAAVLLMTIAVQAADHNEKTVFITRATFDSNLGGLTGADAKCQAEADEPASIVPSGIYMAWLSDGPNSPDSRFTKSSHPYVLPNGKRIAENYNDLTDGSILNPINLDSRGKPVGYQRFWTGTNPDGTTADDGAFNGLCDGWAVDPPAKKYGWNGHTAKKTTSWTAGTGYGCRHNLKLACFQQ